MVRNAAKKYNNMLTYKTFCTEKIEKAGEPFKDVTSLDKIEQELEQAKKEFETLEEQQEKSNKEVVLICTQLVLVSFCNVQMCLFAGDRFYKRVSCVLSA